jgi:STAS-like domain of unknown function (DUF4325)
METIDVGSLVGKNAISMQSGGRLRKELLKALAAEEKVELDFSGVVLFASPFFNSSIGFLLKDLTIEELQERLVFKDLSDVGRSLLNLVIGNAIKYYSNATDINDAINLNEDDEGLE